MVDDLLDLSTIELQDAKDHRSIAVGVLVEEALGRVSALARQRQVALDFVSRGEEAISLLCDQAQMVNALTNLLENAIKYSDSGQLVTIAAYRGDSRGGVVVEVSDDGAGIPDQDQERIFERFYRVDKARSRSTGGTGLGLSIVRHVVEAHGGTIVVESEEGEGSVFRLTLPNSSDVIEEENL
jgi:signal transduction histidine kinase